MNLTGTGLLRDSSVVKVLPEDITSEHTVELQLRRGLPLHHNGLICASAGYDVFGWGAGRLFPEHQSTREEGKNQKDMLYIRAPTAQILLPHIHTYKWSYVTESLLAIFIIFFCSSELEFADLL